MPEYDSTHRFNFADGRQVVIGFYYDAKDRVQMWPLYDVMIDGKYVERHKLPFGLEPGSGWNRQVVERHVRRHYERPQLDAACG